jgi:hypothetical protein
VKRNLLRSKITLTRAGSFDFAARPLTPALSRREREKMALVV